jgi:predicted RNase H-like nuclease (RuvC/YqgF family)
VESFTRDGIMEACEYWKIKRGDVVLLKSSEGGGSQTASLLIKMGVKAVLIRDKISHNAQEEFEKNLVPLLQADNMELKMIDQFAIINALKLEKEIQRWKEVTENKKIKENNQEILKVFDEYRARRKRNID